MELVPELPDSETTNTNAAAAENTQKLSTEDYNGSRGAPDCIFLPCRPTQKLQEARFAAFRVSMLALFKIYC